MNIVLRDIFTLGLDKQFIESSFEENFTNKNTMMVKLINGYSSCFWKRNVTGIYVYGQEQSRTKWNQFCEREKNSTERNLSNKRPVYI